MKDIKLKLVEFYSMQPKTGTVIDHVNKTLVHCTSFFATSEHNHASQLQTICFRSTCIKLYYLESSFSTSSRNS